MSGDREHQDDALRLAPEVLASASTGAGGATLEERLRRIEEAIQRLRVPEGAEPTDREPIGLLESSPGRVEQSEPVERKPLPRAVPIPPAPTASLADFTLPPVALPPPEPDASLRAVMRPLQSSLPLATNLVQRVLPPSSFLRDLWWDLRTGLRMFRDPYYPMSLACKIVPLFALFYVCVWPWFSSWTGLIGTMMSGLVNVVVLYLAFKVLQRELRRYYEFTQRYRR